MISISKSYAENIAREENATYAKLVDSVIETGKIDPKLSLMLDADDICNISVLAWMKLYDEFNQAQGLKAPDTKPCEMCQKWQSTIPLTCQTCAANRMAARNFQRRKNRLCFVAQKKAKKVCEIFNTLDTELKERTMFSLGIERIVTLCLDDHMLELFIGMMRKYQPGAQKPTNDKIEK